MCLNPCCTGIWSQTLSDSEWVEASAWVLILVVKEYGLKRCSVLRLHESSVVLILVVMEYGLRPMAKFENKTKAQLP